MEQQLFIILFFTGVLPLVLSVPRKYYGVNQGKTWSDAQAYCRANHIDLATFDNEAEQIQLYNVAQKQQLTSSTAWIGLYKMYHEWRWSYGNISASWTSWNSGEPSNDGGRGECAAIYSSIWSDAMWTYLFPFVCFDDRLTGDSRYIYYSVPKTWYDAQFTCRVNHVDLANTANPTELSVVKSKISGYTWIGLHRSSWFWSDQTIPSIIRWIPLQPDNNLYNEDCGYLYNGQAADAPCSEVKPFFCYRIITGQQQIIRVKVQSDQDVNDPAVKAAILEKIQQLLLKYGVRNIKLRWRKQPDGEEIRKIPLKALT